MSPVEPVPSRLYIVEDDDRTREELTRILSRYPEFDVMSFADAEGALLALHGAPPDMALLDLRLPKMDGLTLLDHLQEGAPDVMAIIMTGYGDAATPRRARERGAVDFVEKPLDLPYLLVSLRQQAREARLRKSLRVGADLFSRLVELLPDGIVMGDDTGRILFANTLGRTLWEAGFRETGTRATHEGRVYLLDRYAAGDRVLWHWMDLTQALEMERLAGYREMARLLAHEIRNPLTPMRLWLQELSAMDPLDPEYPPIPPRMRTGSSSSRWTACRPSWGASRRWGRTSPYPSDRWTRRRSSRRLPKPWRPSRTSRASPWTGRPPGGRSGSWPTTGPSTSSSSTSSGTRWRRRPRGAAAA